MKLIQRAIAFFRKDGPLKRVLLNTGYLFSSNTLGMFISAVQSILVARMIGVLGVGLVANITKFTTNTSQLLSFRMGELVVSYAGQFWQQGEKEKAASVLRAAAVIEALTTLFKFIVVLAFAPLVATYLVRRPELTPLFIFYSYSIFGNLTSQTSQAALEIFNRFDLLALLNLSQNILSLGVIAVAFFRGGTIVDVVTAYLIAKMFNGIALLVFSLIYARRELGKGWWKVSAARSIGAKEFWRFAVSSNLSATVKLVAQESEELWITYLLSPLAAGYYNIAMKVIAMVLLPINPFIQPTFLEITTQAARRQWDRLKDLLRKTTTIAAAWTLGVGLLLVSLGWWVIPLAYGEEFAPSNAAALILLIGFGTANILYWNRPILLALGKPVYPLVVATVAMGIKVGLSLWLVPQYGYLMQAALLSGYLVVTVGLNAWQGLRTIRIREAEDKAAGLAGTPVEGSGAIGGGGA